MAVPSNRVSGTEEDSDELSVASSSCSPKPPVTANSASVKQRNRSKKSYDSSRLETSVEQVAERLAQGCECSQGNPDSSCFRAIKPESAFKHRLDIAELTRSEHDMYLMGVTMASLSNPAETARHKERKRLRTQYVFQVLFSGQCVKMDSTPIGETACLFLYSGPSNMSGRFLVLGKLHAIPIEAYSEARHDSRSYPACSRQSRQTPA